MNSPRLVNVDAHAAAAALTTQTTAAAAAVAIINNQLRASARCDLPLFAMPICPRRLVAGPVRAIGARSERDCKVL